MNTTSPFHDPCPATGRRVVTVAQWDKRPDTLIDTSAYWFSTDAEEMGMDPWSVIDGIDKHTEGAGFDAWFANGQMKVVTGDQRIYVAAKHYDTLHIGASVTDVVAREGLADFLNGTPRDSATTEFASPLPVALAAEKKRFPPRILALLREVADRKGTATRAPWEDENGEPMQNDADAAIAWIEAQTKQADSGDLTPSASAGK